MPGPRLPTDVVKQRGKKHLSQAEEAERRAGELSVPAPNKATPPNWLEKEFRKEFRQLGKQLIPLGLYTDLDADVLAQFLVCRARWVEADQMTAELIRDRDIERAAKWAGIQATYFKQCRQCAQALGLDVSARCKLVIPSKDDEEEDAFSAYLSRRRDPAER